MRLFRTALNGCAIMAVCMGMAACAQKEDPALKGLGNIPESGLETLKGKTFGVGRDALIVMLHSDKTSGGRVGSIYRHATKVSESYPGVEVLALVRPGYSDVDGQTSPGDLNGRFDHYTPENNRAVADAIRTYAATHGHTRIIGVGYSGGAATLANVAAQTNGMLEAAILLACPCDLDVWPNVVGGLAPLTRSQSPIDGVGNIAPGTRLFLATAQKDPAVPPILAQNYAAAAKATGLDVVLTLPEGDEHRFSLLRADMNAALAQLLN